MTTTERITARIYWDDQDIADEGWAWATRVDGQHDDTGDLAVPDAATDADLVAALRSRLSVEIADEDIEIVR